MLFNGSHEGILFTLKIGIGDDWIWEAQTPDRPRRGKASERSAALFSVQRAIDNWHRQRRRGHGKGRAPGRNQKVVLAALHGLEAAYGVRVFQIDLVVSRCEALLAREPSRTAHSAQLTPKQLLRAISLLAKRGIVHLDNARVGLPFEDTNPRDLRRSY